MLVRAGLTTQDQFIASLSGDIQGVQRTEGRKVQSLRDSSHDAWIKYYRPATNSGDTQISYYTKGAVVGLLLDAKIRSASNGTHSLDDVMRTLFAEHAGGVGYLPADVRRIASEAAGEDLADWFHVAIDSTDELDYQNLADWFGLQVGDVRPTQETSDEEVEASDAEPGNQGTPWLGVGQYGSPATKAASVKWTKSLPSTKCGWKEMPSNIFANSKLVLPSKSSSHATARCKKSWPPSAKSYPGNAGTCRCLTTPQTSKKLTWPNGFLCQLKQQKLTPKTMSNL